MTDHYLPDIKFLFANKKDFYITITLKKKKNLFASGLLGTINIVKTLVPVYSMLYCFIKNDKLMSKMKLTVESIMISNFFFWTN